MSDPSAPFLSLSRPVLAGREWEYVKDCLDSGWVAAGEFVTRFEEAMAKITGARYAVACQSGTAALHLSLLAAGIGAGDAVICPTLTFIATANAISYSGARPVLLGCDEHLNLDPEVVAAYLAHECDPGPSGPVDRQTGLNVRALLPVHIFGNPCDMAALSEIAEQYGLVVIEDAAEALGSRYTQGPLAGRHAGTVGRAGCFSFNGNKIVTCGGGGCVVTDDEATAASVRHLATTAKTDALHYVHDRVGYNYRLTNLAAALGVAQLEQLPAFMDVKRKNLELYRSELNGIPGLSFIDAPSGTAPNHWFYALLVDGGAFGADREALMSHLRERGIESRPVWHLIHRQQPYLRDRSYAVDRAERFHDRVLNLPCSSDVTPADVRRVSNAVREASRGGTARG